MPARVPRPPGSALPLASLVGYAPAPMPAPYPMPYPMFPSLPAKTPQGLGYVRWAVILGAIIQAVSIPGYIWYAFVLSQGAPGDPASFFNLLAASIVFTCASGIVGIVGIIFFALGFYNIHEGRDEYGPEHAREMDRALIYLILAFVMAIVASFGGAGLAPSFLGGTSPFAFLSGAFGAVRGLFVGLLLQSFLKVFVSREDRNLGWIGTIILAVSPAISGVTTFLLFPSFSFSDPSSILRVLPVAVTVAACLAGAELVAYLLFYFVYAKVIARMRAGEFPAMVRPPTMFTPFYPPPMYYPAYPAYPPASPPTNPPDQPPP